MSYKKMQILQKSSLTSLMGQPYNPLQDEGGGCFWRLTNSLLSLGFRPGFRGLEIGCLPDYMVRYFGWV